MPKGRSAQKKPRTTSARGKINLEEEEVELEEEEEEAEEEEGDDADEDEDDDDAGEDEEEEKEKRLPLGRVKSSYLKSPLTGISAIQSAQTPLVDPEKMMGINDSRSVPVSVPEGAPELDEELKAAFDETHVETEQLPMFPHEPNEKMLDPEKVAFLVLYQYTSGREMDQMGRIDNKWITDVEIIDYIRDKGWGPGVYVVNARAHRSHTVLRWSKAFRVRDIPRKFDELPSANAGTAGNGRNGHAPPAFSVDPKGMIIPNSNDPGTMMIVWMQKQEEIRRQEHERMEMARREEYERRDREMQATLERMRLDVERQIAEVKAQSERDIQIEQDRAEKHLEMMNNVFGRSLKETEAKFAPNEDVMDMLKEQKEEAEKQIDLLRREREQLRDEAMKAKQEAALREQQRMLDEMKRLREELRDAKNGSNDGDEPTLVGAIQESLPMLIPIIAKKMGVDIPGLPSGDAHAPTGDTPSS